MTQRRTAGRIQGLRPDHEPAERSSVSSGTRLVALIAAIGDNPLADSFAKQVAEILVEVYPNHAWWIECKGGVLIIKHLEASGARGLIGMLRKMDAIPRGKGLRGELVRAAGEMLERANMPRGPREQDPVTSFEFDDRKMEKYWKAPGMVLH